MAGLMERQSLIRLIAAATSRCQLLQHAVHISGAINF